ncbi:MAG: hypothetical protein Tsb0020_45840 [Haliangiales bacterium]
MQSARWIVPSLLALALVAVGAAPALAGSHEGVTMPDNVTVEGTSLVLNGMGLREATMFKVDVYVAGLYLEKKSSNGDAIVKARSAKRIHLQFKRDVDRDDMVKALEGAFNKNAGSKKSALSGEMKTFKSWLTKLDEGDTMTFSYAPDKGLMVDINGKRKGTIAGDDFASVIFAGWLGKNATDKDLRKQLLGR